MKDFWELVVEWLSGIFTMANITFALATIGAVGTAVDVLKSKRSLKFKLNYFGYSKERKLAVAYIQVDNYSRLPISITDLHLKINDVSYPCRKLPTKVVSHDRKIGPNIVSSQDFYNIPFPIQISPLGGASGYFLFDIPLETDIMPSMPRSFQVSANRGHAMQISLSPDQEYFGK